MLIVVSEVGQRLDTVSELCPLRKTETTASLITEDPEDRQTDRQANNQAERQTDRWTDRHLVFS